MAKYAERLTIVIRDDGPMIHCGDSPAYRTITVQLTQDQVRLIKLRSNEEISRCILEPTESEAAK